MFTDDDEEVDCGTGGWKNKELRGTSGFCIKVDCRLIILFSQSRQQLRR